MYQKWRSYDVWLLKYKAWQTEYFVIYDHFLPFQHPDDSESEYFEKLKKDLEILSFYTCVP